jgi:hypothetical protein
MFPLFASEHQSQSVFVHLAGRGLPLPGSGLDEEPTSVPQGPGLFTRLAYRGEADTLHFLGSWAVPPVLDHETE